MPRQIALILLGWLGLLVPASAQAIGPALPVWTLAGPPGPVVPGEPFEVRATVRLPEGYYQDADSPFLSLEVSAPAQTTGRSATLPTVRGGKASYTGSFVLVRTLTLPLGTAPGPLTLAAQAGWQICRPNGVCLLPGHQELGLALTVGPGPQMGAAGPVPGAPGSTPESGVGAFWGALAAAFLGGLVLNLMPCVFPVMALKALALASAQGLSLAARRREALASAAGGLGSLVVLGVVTALVALGGQRLNWGFSFQQPLFVGALALVFWALALELFGLWTWPASPFRLPWTRAGTGRQAFWGGVLLVVAAAPCTAPFLGPALGYAFTRPPVEVPLFFAAAGLGLVLPLLVVSWVPGLGRLLPAPGPWMGIVEKGAGVLLAGTAVALMGVVLEQVGPGRWVGAALVLAGVAGALARPLVRRRALGLGLLGLSLVTAGVGAGLLAAPGNPGARPLPEGWVPYSTEALARLTAEGTPVFVDGTAAWCATCQVNEWGVLGRADVRRLFGDRGVVLMRADDTRPNPEVEDWVAAVGRAGLPVYALYRPGRPVVLFPELLTDANFVDRLPALLAPSPQP